MDLAHLVDASGVEEDPLGRRRFARVDVRHDPDVSGLLDDDRTFLHLQCHAHLSTSTGNGRKPCCFPPSGGFPPCA